MTLLTFLGSLPAAAGILSLLTRSLALFIVGWGLARAFRRTSPPLRSGMLLAAMVLLLLLPFATLVLRSGQAALYHVPISPAGGDLTNALPLSDRSSADGAEAKARPIGQGQDALAGHTGAGHKPGGLSDLLSLNPLLLVLNGFGLIWLLGFLVSLGRVVHGLIFLSGFRSSLIAIPEEDLSRALEAVRETFPKTRLPAVHVSPAVDSPVALGIARPVVVLPKGLTSRLSEEELVSILIHETGHIRHLDHVAGLLQRLLTSVYWWNPLAYSLSASFSVTREEISDNYAIQKSGARSYARCLVALAGKMSLVSRLPAAVGMATRYMPLEDRVKNIVSKERIMATRMKKPLVVFLAATAVLLGTLVVRYSWTLTSGTAGVRTFALPPGAEPQVLAADKDRIYLCAYENYPQKPESHIAIYTQSDFSLLARIGQVGKGPGEFLVSGPGRFRLENGQIWAQDIGKILIFSRDGVFQKEVQIPRDFFAFIYPFLPLNRGFVSLAGDWSDVVRGNARVFGRLYDSELRMTKEFYGEIPIQAPPPPPPPPAPPGQKSEPETKKTEAAKKVYQAIPDCINLAVAEGKIFVADSRKGFHIEVFDSAGTPLYEIDHVYDPLPVPAEYTAGLKKKLNDTQAWLNEVADVRFRDTFPAFYSFTIDGGKIYVATYAEKDGLNELVVMDLKGNVLKRSFSFPLGPSYDSMYNNFNVAKDRYTISENKLFYVTKGVKAGSYEVRIQDLE